jgi:F-type H+-transporting ATPase subunit gamma
METVSAVRYRKYYKKWLESINFYDSLAQLAYLVVTAEKTIDHPLMYGNDSKCNVILAIGTDRGLCGGYNSNIYRQIETHRKMTGRFGKKLEIYAQGKKVITHLNNRGIEITKSYDEFEEVPTAEQAKEIADDFIDQYLTGRIGRLGVVYTRFFTPASQRTQTLTILPVAELIDDLTTRATVIWPWELAFEDFLLSPSAEEIFDSLAKMMIRTAIQGCFLEAALSEHLGRVIAMRSATDNASEMIEELTRDYNRARQGQITMELLDIIGASVVT